MHRVFPSSCIKSHLHDKFNFMGLMLETPKQSLHRLCKTELTRQGILLPQDRQGYGRRLLEFIKKTKYFFFSFDSTGQMSDFIRRITTLQNLMFLINSRHSLFIFDINRALFPEVTELSCRVPLTPFSPLPYFFQKIYVCSSSTILYFQYQKFSRPIR